MVVKFDFKILTCQSKHECARAIQSYIRANAK